jgi:hypothetical protein
MHIQLAVVGLKRAASALNCCAYSAQHVICPLEYIIIIIIIIIIYSWLAQDIDFFWDALLTLWEWRASKFTDTPYIRIAEHFSKMYVPPCK